MRSPPGSGSAGSMNADTSTKVPDAIAMATARPIVLMIVKPGNRTSMRPASLKSIDEKFRGIRNG